ncbi:ADP-ribosylglycohydrolase family protein [Hoeflea poritis]|uniref:ADP-ribosylglycohydrolase family protein n=1 Tax=Hoeflea poritis TaxID=2993659 RepID=A0ABT4VNC2_9HYPH|nr:ADP-ribosylglycohydrolase family protein [Hoeflea poritis]MDA4846179.1 ADP-ribosylglycohydrolase family protein [Hoeflea poritis]
MSNKLPPDYLERVYAGVLGKLIGVYLGRPFEGWTYQRIMRELGPIRYYVHERLGDPLVITDDDVAGTFTFVRALEDHRLSEDLSAEEIGKVWLNYIVEERSILWWGGAGNSTEHTAWLNLDKGMPAPASGSIETNGATVAEQIGAQIFIDGWALVAPGRPEVAARLAEQAGKVSHDGESVHAAMLWAAMEAEAFNSRDVDHLLDTGLSVIPSDCLISRLIGDIRRWAAEANDWTQTRQKIEDSYGYDKYPGNCHVVPNHALMVMALLHAPDDFHRGQMIVNTSGWDTDCNAGNLGCLQGIMLGLEGIENGPDWRGPISDRMLISSADGGNAITDAVRTSYYLANLGAALAGAPAYDAPKQGARFHFSLPGSTQGFAIKQSVETCEASRVENVGFQEGRALGLRYTALADGLEVVAMTPTFTPPEVTQMRTYDLMASPCVYPGQTLSARIAGSRENEGDVTVALAVGIYNSSDGIDVIEADPQTLAPGAERVLEWRLPETGGQPIAEVGLTIRAAGRRADGTVLVDWMTWSGVPEMELKRPEGDGDFWWRAWVSDCQFFSKRFRQSFRMSNGRGTGLILQGARDWNDFEVDTEIMIHAGSNAGVIARAQGRKRYYAVVLDRKGEMALVRQFDDETTTLASGPIDFEFETPIPVKLTVRGKSVHATVNGATLEAKIDSGPELASGAMGLLVTEGAVSADRIRISPAA